MSELAWHPRIAPVDGLSHVRGQAHPPLDTTTVHGLLANATRSWPEAGALVFPHQCVRWTWARFGAEVDRFASGLHALGLEVGDRVGIWSPNRVEWLVTQFATARLGLVLVNINPAYRTAELEYALNKAGCKALVTAEKLRSSMYLEMLHELAPELESCAPGRLVSARLPALRSIIRMGDGHSQGMFRYDEVLQFGDECLDIDLLDEIGDRLHFRDPINIQFTSGTTGNPKGATLSHFNVVNNARFVAAAMKLTHADSLCVPVPMYHCFGMVLSVLACISVGAGMVFPGEVFDAGATLAAVASEKCTALHGVPTMFIAQLDHADFGKYDLSSLRTGIMAGAPCPVETMKRVVAEMNMREVTIAFGMTETSPVSFQSSTTDPLELRVSSVGRIHPHVEAKVVNASGVTVPLGVPGEIWVRGYSVMLGYWDDEARTRESMVDGWMRTGDLGTIDADGYCNIVGRVKDMLIRGGENIYPREIEEFLFRHPKVQSVQVFGVPDARYGEEVCAWIVLKPGETATDEDIRAFCRGQIAHYKVPRYVRFVAEMPMTITGKAQKFVMRRKMIDELRLEQPRMA